MEIKNGLPKGHEEKAETLARREAERKSAEMKPKKTKISQAIIDGLEEARLSEGSNKKW